MLSGLTRIVMKHLNLGFFASHGGSNMQAIIDACKKGHLNATPCVVISNNSDSMALERAKKEGIPAFHFSTKTHSNPGELDSIILKTLQKYDVNIIILAGYMRMLGKPIQDYYRNRILNIHPALLPKFGGKGMYGQFVHEAVIAAGEKKSGVTVHLVSEKYDEGPIISQRDVPVFENDTPQSLAQRVLVQEHKFFSETLQKISTGEIDLDNLASRSFDK